MAILKCIKCERKLNEQRSGYYEHSSKPLVRISYYTCPECKTLNGLVYGDGIKKNFITTPICTLQQARDEGIV